MDTGRVKTHSSSITVALALLLLGSWLVSAGHCSETDALIDQALKSSGVAGQLKSLIPAVVAAFPGDAFSDANVKRRVQSRVEAVLTDETLLEMVRETVRRNFDRPTLEQVLAFYESKLGRKVGGLQGRSLTASRLADVREGGKVLALMPGTRLALCKRIVQEQQVSDTQGRLLKSMIAGLAASRQESPESGAGVIRPELRPLIERAASTADIFEQMAVAASAGTFRSLSDKELQDLAAYEESDAARWFRRVSLPGVERAVYEIARTLGQTLRELRSDREREKR
jgi:hypothetical protein